MSDASNPLRLEVVGVLRNGRRRYDLASKRRLVEACLQPDVSLAGLALQHGVNANLLRKWVTGQQHRQRNGAAVGVMECATEVFVPVVELCGVVGPPDRQLGVRSSTLCTRQRPRATRIRLRQG